VETTDPLTFVTTTVESIVAGAVKARVKFTAAQGQDVESGGQHPVVQRVEVHVPVGTVPMAPGVFARVSGSLVDVGLVGRVFRVAERPPGGQVTAYRIPVEEVS
jgi:hypothetical protein